MHKPFALILLTLLLAACAPAATLAPTETPVPPTATFLSPPTRRVEQVVEPSRNPVETLTPTLEAAPLPATPLPTEARIPAYILTPDAVQVTRWQEYQTELIKVLLADYGPALYAHALCEWDILARSGQEVYVWAYCAFEEGGSRGVPAIIHLNASGSVQTVEAPRYGEAHALDIQRLFPAEVRAKINLYYDTPNPYTGRPEVLRLHLHYRREHPDEPPLIVLLAMPTATSTP